MLCSHCGKELPVGATACPYCGCAVNGGSASPFKKAGSFDTAPESDAVACRPHGGCATADSDTSSFKKAGSFGAAPESNAAPTSVASGEGEERSTVIFSRPHADSTRSEVPSGVPTSSFSDGTPASAPAAHSYTAETPKAAFCGQCGARIAPGNRFCPECGAPITPGPDPAVRKSASSSGGYSDATIDLAYASRVELKELAKKEIKGKIGILFVVSLIYFGVSFGTSFILAFIPIVGVPANLLVQVIIIPMFSLSMCHIYLNVTAHSNVAVKDMFCGIDDVWSAIKVNFFVNLFTALWSLLLIVPGIIKSLSYSMSFYILAENKGMPALECIQRSKEMTQGHKTELFKLRLSFLGWYLLEVFTFGIAGIYVIPYMRTTEANFYCKLKSLTRD